MGENVSASLNNQLKKLKKSVLCVYNHSSGPESSHLHPLAVDVAIFTSVPLEKAPSGH